MTKRTTDQWAALLDGWEYDTDNRTLLGARNRTERIMAQAKAAPEAVAEVVRLRRELARLAVFIDGYPLQQVIVSSPNNGQRALDMQAKSLAIIKHILGGDTHD